MPTTERTGSVRDEDKSGVMFWTDTGRKQRFAKECKRRGLNMTDAFENFMSALLDPENRNKEFVPVDTRPVEASVGGRGMRREPPEARTKRKRDV